MKNYLLHKQLNVMQQQAQYDANATETILSSLVDFSTTIQKTAAKRTAKQLEDQTKLAAAQDITTISADIVEAYKQGEFSLLKGGLLDLDNILENGVKSGERFSKTLSNIAGEVGLGAIGKKALLNRVYGRVHSSIYSQALQKNPEAANDPEKLAALQSSVNTELSGFMLKAYGVSESLYFADAKIKVLEENEAELNRSHKKKEELSKEIILQTADNLGLEGTTNAYTAGYKLAKTTGSYAEGHTYLVNQIGFAETDTQVEAIGNIITDDGRLYKDRFPNKFKPAVQARVDNLNKRNRENRRVQKETLDNNLYEAREPILQRLNENPAEIYDKVTQEYYAQGATPPSWFKEAYRSAVTGANEKFAEELATLERAGGTVSAERINAERNLTNREKLVKLRSAQIEQQYGGQAGLDQLKGLEALARKRTNIAVNGGRNSPITYTLLAGMEQRWKEHFATTQDVVKATQLLEADLFEADKKENPNALFAAKYDNDGNALSYPNLSSTDLDTDQRLTLLQTKLGAKRSLGEITDMPSMLGKPSDLAAISIQSETSNNIQFTRETMYLAAKFGKKPSEIHNAQVTANNKAYGTNTPLINPTIKSEAIDNASPADAKLMNSIFRVQNTRGAANYTGTANRPENMRSTFRNTPLQSFAPQVSSVTFDTGQPGIDVFFEDHNFPAVLPGMVKDIGYQVNANGSGYGHYLVIESIDPDTGEPVDVLYGHLPSKPTQSRGQSINLGEIIGKQGGTGSVQSYDGTIASIDFLAPAAPGSGSMTPYRNYDSLRRNIASQFQ